MRLLNEFGWDIIIIRVKGGGVGLRGPRRKRRLSRDEVKKPFTTMYTLRIEIYCGIRRMCQASSSTYYVCTLGK